MLATGGFEPEHGKGGGRVGRVARTTRRDATSEVRHEPPAQGKRSTHTRHAHCVTTGASSGLPHLTSHAARTRPRAPRRSSVSFYEKYMYCSCTERMGFGVVYITGTASLQFVQGEMKDARRESLELVKHGHDVNWREAAITPKESNVERRMRRAY